MQRIFEPNLRIGSDVFTPSNLRDNFSIDASLCKRVTRLITANSTLTGRDVIKLLILSLKFT